MTEDEVQTYWFAAHKAFPEVPDIGYRRSQALAKLLGIVYPYTGYHYELELTERLKFILRQLAGPYGLIIRKMLEVKKRDT